MKTEWHVQDVGTVSVRNKFEGFDVGGVRLRDIGFDLLITPSEARRLARVLMAAADAIPDRARIGHRTLKDPRGRLTPNPSG